MICGRLLRSISVAAMADSGSWNHRLHKTLPISEKGLAHKTK